MSADRERLAAALADWTGAWTREERDDLLDVVQALVAEGAAAELRAAADGAETGTWRDPITGPDVAAMLRARADALLAAYSEANR